MQERGDRLAATLVVVVVGIVLLLFVHACIMHTSCSVEHYAIDDRCRSSGD